MQSGDQLGHYEITGHLGSGGMGEVYRARDTSLQRDVAVKVLPVELSGDAERLARFEREARLLAQLDHPNIAAVHGLDRDGERTFLVMQLAPGETLGERIGNTPMDPADAVAIARQIAEGMEAAHERGIVHRDLKPANVMVADDGSVKILDFGLAKALAGEGDAGTAPELSASPTMMAGTVAGVILGTAAYMSPEQARGLPVDRRADIWAFGAVLYEMLSGRQPFTGDTVTDVLASVVKEDPDWDALPESTPTALRALLGRCLEKNPKQRLRDIGEARIALEGGNVLAAAAGPAAGATASRPRSSAPLIVGIVMAAVVTIVLAALFTRPATVDTPLLRGAVSLPPDMILNIEGDNAGPPQLSPDGRRFVFSAATPQTPLQLWVRSLDDPEPRPLPGTEGGYFPFWSPDGQSIAFFSRDRLVRMDLDSGQILTIATGIELGRPGAWHPDGSIYYTASTSTPIAVVDEDGQSEPVNWPMDVSLQSTQRWAQLLPDGEHILFFAGRHEDLTAETTGIWVARRDGSEMRQLLRSASGGVYAGGHILFVRESSLLAQPFDVDTLDLTGDPVSLGDSVAVDATTWGSTFTAADNGTLVYVPADQPTGRLLRWVDRQGNRLETWQPAGNYQTIRLSPDSRWLMAEFQQAPVSQLYLYDSNGRSEQITFLSLDTTTPVWSDDGETIFAGRWGGADSNYFIVTMPFRGGDATTLFGRDGEDVWAYDLVTGQNALVVGSGQYYSRSIRSDLWVVPLDGGSAYALPIGDGLTPIEAAVSHDGRSIAFTARTASSSVVQVYVAPLLPVDGKLQVGSPRRQMSQDGGYLPRWRGDDGELFFLQGSGLMTAVTVERGDRGEVLRSDSPEVLFAAGLAYSAGLGYSYDVDDDGQRFILLETDTRGRMLALVSDWRQALARATR